MARRRRRRSRSVMLGSSTGKCYARFRSCAEQHEGRPRTRRTAKSLNACSRRLRTCLKHA